VVRFNVGLLADSVLSLFFGFGNLPPPPLSSSCRMAVLAEPAFLPTARFSLFPLKRSAEIPFHSDLGTFSFPHWRGAPPLLHFFCFGNLVRAGALFNSTQLISFLLFDGLPLSFTSWRFPLHCRSVSWSDLLARPGLDLLFLRFFFPFQNPFSRRR